MKMKKLVLILALLLISTSAMAQGKAKESAYDRVMRTQTIRCGYTLYLPNIIKDANTGKISGIAAETIERIAKDLSLKVEWVEEVGTASMMEGLMTDRYDMVCTAIWSNTARARQAIFTEPLYYTALGAYVRADDGRFGNGLEALNAPGIKIATMDGSESQVIARDDFPLAQQFSMPDLTDHSQLLLSVATGKADVVFAEAFLANSYMEQHPGTLKNLAAANPVRLFGNGFMLKTGEVQLRDMLNIAIQNMHNSNAIEKIISKYETYPGSFYRVIKPYRISE
jgi:cyclohexadienyl dehydratase